MESEIVILEEGDERTYQLDDGLDDGCVALVVDEAHVDPAHYDIGDLADFFGVAF